jgi:hypothetical protein
MSAVVWSETILPAFTSTAKDAADLALQSAIEDKIDRASAVAGGMDLRQAEAVRGDLRRTAIRECDPSLVVGPSHL